MLRTALTCLLTAAFAGPSLAQDAYLDDRSTPQTLIRSLYNAINRHEYGRAWAYFSEAPAADVETYARGYEDTERIELIVGTPSEEGAAGSIYFQAPVAIRAESRSGDSRVFAGCYTLRMTNPGIEGEFSPLHIERGRLRPTDAALESALPRRCEDGADLPEHDSGLEKARAIYATLDRCNLATLPGTEPEDLAPDVHSIGFHYAHDTADIPQSTATLYRFPCSRGAYNEGHVYFLQNDIGEVSPLHFAEPELDIRYADDENEKVESMTVIGFSTSMELINSDFDPQTLSLHAFSKWRGLGDASSSGTWEFREGDFRLVHYSVDASYDGEMNGETVVEYNIAP